jgi:hypothetical protein
MGRHSGSSFPKGLSGRAMILSVLPLVVLRLKMCGATFPNTIGPASLCRDVYLNIRINFTQEIKSEIIRDVNFEESLFMRGGAITCMRIIIVGFLH